jgi:hypothetical protein
MENVIVEMYGCNNNSKNISKYEILTGNNFSKWQQTAFYDRKNKNWQNVFKIYFDGSDRVIESFKKLGINIRKNNSPDGLFERIYNAKKPKYVMSNNYWFWKIIEFGYRLGANKNITYETHIIREHLKSLIQWDNTIFEINKHESENPIFEAQLLVA